MCTQWKRCERAEDMEDMEGVTMEDRLSLHQCTSSRGHRRSWTYLLIKTFLRRDEKHEIKQTVETIDRVTSRITQQTISKTSRLISKPSLRKGIRGTCTIPFKAITVFGGRQIQACVERKLSLKIFRLSAVASVDSVLFLDIRSRVYDLIAARA